MVSFCKKKSPVLSFPKSLQSLQSGLSAVGVRHDSFYYFPELFPQYRPCNCSSRFACRYCECSPVKHLRVDDHPSFFIVQKLHPVPSSVDEDIHVSVSRICTHSIIHYSTQCVEAFTHVRRFAIQPVALFCPKTKHDSLMPIRLWTGLSEGSSLPVSASSCRWLCASLYSDSLCMSLAGTLTSSLVQNSSGWVRKCLLASIGGTLLPAFRFPLYTCAWHHRIAMMQSPVPSVCRIA